MEVLLLLIPISVLLVLAIGALFWWSIRSGQFDDLDGPAHRILDDDDTNDAIPAALPESRSSVATQASLTSVKPTPNKPR
jgi:cbb3-type cytochrome oxidase maturation protein